MRYFLRVWSSSLQYAKKHWFVFFAVAVYLFFSAYYMGPGFTRCNDSIYGFGDSTAGPIWRNSLKPAQPPFGGYETSTNYPYGESTYSPVGFVASVQTISMWAASKVVGPMCAYNLYNITGYVLTAIVMFAFIRYLTKNRWIALLAGYAVSFSPYVQGKVGGHPNYGFAALLIGILWLVFHTLHRRRRWSAVLLGLLLALSAYLDPYFTLLAATVAGPAFIVWLAVAVVMARNANKAPGVKALLHQTAKGVVYILASFLILILPLLIIRVVDAGTISQTVSASRGDVFAAARLCSNMPTDYLLPDPSNIHLNKLLGATFAAKNIAARHWCGPGESRVSLSITLMMVVTSGAVAALVGFIRKRKSYKLSIAYPARNTLAAVVAVGLSGVALGLPPTLHGILMPSGFILKITATWRIFAREYLVVNVALVILAAITLHFIFTNYALFKKPIVRIGLVVVIFIGILFEYQVNNPFSPITFSYKRDVPSVYYTIKDTPKINAIAEYPMDRIGVEYDSVVYYMTMQAVHGKKLVNSVLATDSRMTTHIALKDLSDPQTIPALRYLGVRYVVVHGENIDDILSRTNGNLEVVGYDTPKVYSLTMVRQDDNNNVVLLHIKDGVKSSSILTIEKGASVNLPLIQSPLATEFEIQNGAVLRKTPLEQPTERRSAICFDVKMSAVTDLGDLSISYGEHRLDLGTIAGTSYTHVVVPDIADNESIMVRNDKGYNMRLNNLSASCEENVAK